LTSSKKLTIKEVKEVLKAQLEGLKKEGDKDRMAELNEYVVTLTLV
jgi:hypothetical protein